MDYEAWQHKRGQLMEKERAERSINWTQSRAPIQAAITEQAVRELYDKVAALEETVKPHPVPADEVKRRMLNSLIERPEAEAKAK